MDLQIPLLQIQSDVGKMEEERMRGDYLRKIQKKNLGQIEHKLFLKDGIDLIEEDIAEREELEMDCHQLKLDIKRKDVEMDKVILKLYHVRLNKSIRNIFIF